MTIVVPYSVESLRCYPKSIAPLREEDMLSEIETIAETNKVIKQVVEWLGPELVSNQEIPDHSTPKPWEGGGVSVRPA